jgi:hypothetical protein
VARVLRQLKFDDYSKPKAKEPLVQRYIRDLQDLRGVTSGLGSYIAFLHLVAHDGLLRSGELTSGLLVGDFEETRETRMGARGD